MNLDNLLGFLRSLAPEEMAMPNDPIGLLIEPLSREISSVVVCLDATSQVAQQAVKTGAQLIIAHHPLIYHPLKRLDRSDPISSLAMDLVHHGIGLFAMHTNWDIASGGINDTLAAELALADIRPLPGAPIARIGKLSSPITPELFLAHVSKSLACTGTSSLRHTPTKLTKKQISKVAVCGGAGASLMEYAIGFGADAFVTSDVKHDQFIDAVGRGVFLIDAGHEATEAPGMKTLCALLAKELPETSVAFCANWTD